MGSFRAAAGRNYSGKVAIANLPELLFKMPTGGGSAEYFVATTRGAESIYHPPKRRAKFGALASQHLLVGCAMIYAAAPAPAQAEHLSENGRYSVDKVRAKTKKFAEAIEKGFKVLVIDWRIRIIAPMALQLLASAGNSDTHVSAPEWEHSVLGNMWAQAAKQLDAGREPLWHEVEKVAFSNSPPCMDVKHQLTQFCIQACGANADKGEHEAMYLSEWVRFHAERRHAARIPGKLYAAAAEMSMRFPRVAMAQLKVLLMTETYEGSWATGVTQQQFLTPLRKVDKGDEEMTELIKVAEKVLNMMRVHLAQAGVTELPTEDVGLIKYLGAADFKVGELILGRRIPSKAPALAVCDAASTFMQQLLADDAFKHANFASMTQTLQEIQETANTRVKSLEDKAASEQAARQEAPQHHMASSDRASGKVAKASKKGVDDADDQKLSIVKRDSTGALTCAAHTLGMNGMGVGKTVHARTDGIAKAGEYMVSSITDDKVVIVGGSGPVEIPLKEFESKFKSGKMGSDGTPVPAPGWPMNNTVDRPDVRVGGVKGEILANVVYLQHAFLTPFSRTSSNFSVISDPPEKRGVFVSKAVDSGQIVLTPDSRTVKMVLEEDWTSEEVPLRKGVEVGVTGLANDIPRARFYLEPENKPQLRGLFWTVAPTTRRAKANMTVVWLKVNSWHSHDVDFGRTDNTGPLIDLFHTVQGDATDRLQTQMRNVLEDRLKAGEDMSRYETLGDKIIGLRGLFPADVDISSQVAQGAETGTRADDELPAVPGTVAQAPLPDSRLKPAVPKPKTNAPVAKHAAAHPKVSAATSAKSGSSKAAPPVAKAHERPIALPAKTARLDQTEQKQLIFHTISLPILVNTTAIPEGTELRYYESAPDPKDDAKQKTNKKRACVDDIGPALQKVLRKP